jgi:lysylphosphatidylglycerol synthetase-like protein (DUF2156 family)
MPVSPVPDIALALPEILLAAGAMALLIFGAISGENSTRTVSWLAIAVLIVALVVSLAQGGARHLGFYGMFVTDAFALFMKALGGHDPDGHALQRGSGDRAVRVPGSRVALDDRDDGHDLGE